MARNALVAVVAAAAVDGGGEIPSKIFGHDFQSFFLLEDKYRREQEEEEQQRADRRRRRRSVRSRRRSR